MEQFKIKFIPSLPGIYFVGGCVRDKLLGRPCRDIDIAVDGDPAAVAGRIAKAARAHPPVRLGKSKKSILRVVADTCIFDVIRLNGATIDADLRQRDFTINALAVEADTGRMIDPAGGYADIRAGIIRQVSKTALNADPIRILRAFRIGAELGFSISEETIDRISALAALINNSAGERIREEWIRFLSVAGSFRFLVQMDASGLIDNIFPELSPLKGCNQNRHHKYDVFAHSMAAYRHMELLIENSIPGIFEPLSNRSQLCIPALLKHAALIHDIGKASAKKTDKKGEIHFYGHEKTGEQLARRISDRLHFSNPEKAYVNFLLSNHLTPPALYSAHARGCLTKRTITRFFIRHEPWVPDLLALSVADMTAKGFTEKAEKYVAFIKNLSRFRQDEYLPAKAKKRLITGHDLITYFSLDPSPDFKQILEYADILQRTGQIQTKDDAIREVGIFIDRNGIPAKKP